MFWYDAATQCGVGADILGLVAAQAVLMHYVEIRRWRDVTHPGSVDKDPLFNFSLASHEVGYPGGIFAPFVPGDLDDLKKKEIKNGRLAMLSLRLPAPKAPRRQLTRRLILASALSIVS